jgi:hypothetical protein
MTKWRMIKRLSLIRAATLGSSTCAESRRNLTATDKDTLYVWLEDWVKVEVV